MITLRKSITQKCQDIANTRNPFLVSTLGNAYGVAGKKEEAQKILNEVLERRKRGYFSPQAMSKIYAGLGDIDKAFECLDKAYEERDLFLFLIKSVPSHDYLHSDLRWKALMKKMGLED